MTVRRVAKRTVVLVVLASSACSGSPSADVRPGPSPAGPPGSTAPDAPSGSPPSVVTSVASPTTPPAIATGTLVPTAGADFAATDRALQSRVSSAGLAGGVVLVVQNGSVVHDHAVGSVRRSTPLSVASSAKWLTAATLMTYVDEGVVGLDDPVSRWLPEFADEQPAVTVRALLDHTSGVRDQSCLWNTGGRLADCVRAVANSPRQFPPGTAFSYGNAGFHVIGRVLEVLGGADFATVVQRRLTGPLGMAATSWPGAPNNPSPAAGTRTTVDDYGRFLAMVLGRGVIDGNRILSTSAIDELVRNQVAAYDTSGDYSVGITDIPRYSLGAWPDVVDDAGSTVVVSGNGGSGFYPWIDFSTNSYGVIGVQDDRGAEVAVPASQHVAATARQALTH